MQKSYVYIMSNNSRSVLYIGVTSDIRKRILEHKNKVGSVFTNKYNCHSLVYFEEFGNILNAIEREKQLKNWKRLWKDELIKAVNPEMY